MNNRFFAAVPPVRMYPDDLTVLVDLLGGAAVTVSHAGRDYPSVGALRGDVARAYLTEFEAGTTVGDAEISVTIEPAGAWVSASGDGRARAAAAVAFLRTRARWYSWRPEGHWWDGLRGYLAGIMALALVFAVRLYTASYMAYGLVIAASAVIVLAGLSSRVWLGGSRVYLRERQRR